MSGLQILCGIGLIFFGLRFLRKGLDRLFGGNMIRWIAHTTASPLRAFGAGIGAGVIAPSSTGLSLAAVQMLDGGRVSSRSMLAVLLGANVGMTLTVQLISFHIQDYAGLFVITGVALFQFTQRELFRGVGQCLLSLGFVFLAMQLIGQGANAMAAMPEITSFLHLVEGHPWLVMSIVGLFAVALQSSTATIGLGLGLGSTGMLTPEIMVPWIIGTNMGLCITCLAAGWPKTEGRRLGLGNLLSKAALAIPLMALPGVALWLFELWPGSFMRQTAMFHTGFNLVVGILALCLLRPLDALTRFLVASPPRTGLELKESFLDRAVLDSPSLALARATRETLRMADNVRSMLEGFWTAFTTNDVGLARLVQQKDDLIDRMNLDLKDYLCRIGEEKSAGDTHWQFLLLNFSNELESVGDLVDKHLCDLLIKLQLEGVMLGPEDRNDLEEAYRRVMERFEVAVDLLTTRNGDAATDFLSSKSVFKEWFRQCQAQHYQRLNNSPSPSLVSSAFHLDFFNAFRRINSHLGTISHSLNAPTER